MIICHSALVIFAMFYHAKKTKKQTNTLEQNKLLKKKFDKATKKQKKSEKKNHNKVTHK